MNDLIDVNAAAYLLEHDTVHGKFPGEIKVEVQDERGIAVAGFTSEDCHAIIGNEIDRTVRWKTDKKIEDLQGKVIRLRFILKDCDLFSIKFD